jgi:hypothetical protein
VRDRPPKSYRKTVTGTLSAEPASATLAMSLKSFCDSKELLRWGKDLDLRPNRSNEVLEWLAHRHIIIDDENHAVCFRHRFDGLFQMKIAFSVFRSSGHAKWGKHRFPIPSTKASKWLGWPFLNKVNGSRFSIHQQEAAPFEIVRYVSASSRSKLALVLRH